jgi:hypothetical protein
LRNKNNSLKPQRGDINIAWGSAPGNPSYDHIESNSKKGRVYFRFPKGERIQIQKDTSIALPILKWLNAEKGDGLLIFATNQVKRLFRLSELIKYNQSEDVKLQ